MDVMKTLVKNILDVTYEDLSGDAVASVKKSFIDNLGVMIAGSSVTGCELLVGQIREWGGREESTIAVYGGRVPSYLAAQANGAMARALEIDDIIDTYPLHPSASIIPTSLAIAEHRGEISGKELITAIALGQDLVIRMGVANRLTLVDSGRYNLFRVFAVTGVAGRLLGLDEEQLLNAMGIAYSQMVGDFQAVLDGAMSAYIQQGTIAKSAIESAVLAQSGITGSRNVLQGRDGFYNAFEPDPNVELLVSDLGKRFRGAEISIKLYTACRFSHEAIDLALDFTREEKIEPKSIEQIIVRVNEQVYNTVCDPLPQKHNPKTLVDAQFSLPYAVAASMIRGQFFIDELSDEVIRDPGIVNLTRRITPIKDDKCLSELVIGSTIMEIKMQNGQWLSKKIEFPRGNPKNPVGIEGCIEKFRKCIGYSKVPFPNENEEKLISLIQDLEKLEDAVEIAGLISANP